MNNIKATVSLLLLASSFLTADDTLKTENEESVASKWNFNVLIEDRIFSDKTSQTLLKLQTDTDIAENLSFFGALWLRDQVPVYVRDDYPHLAESSDYINYSDIYAGIIYTKWRYFEPYAFFEEYYERASLGDKWGNFAAVGFGGTLYDEGKHNISYYTEAYYSISVIGHDGFDLWSTETAAKYKYKIYGDGQIRS